MSIKILVSFAIGVVIGAAGGYVLAWQKARAAVIGGPYSDNYPPALAAISEAKTKLQSGDTNVLENLNVAQEQIQQAQQWTTRFLGRQGHTAVDAAEILRDQIVSKHRMVITDTNSVQIVWSDGVILEIADTLPLPIRSLVDHTPYHTDILSTVRKVEAGLQTEYRPSRMREKSSHRGYVEFEPEASKDPVVVDPVYVSYVHARYPDCSTLVKGKYDPVAFAVKGQIKALIMPVKLSSE